MTNIHKFKYMFTCACIYRYPCINMYISIHTYVDRYTKYIHIYTNNLTQRKAINNASNSSHTLFTCP